MIMLIRKLFYAKDIEGYVSAYKVPFESGITNKYYNL